MKWSLSSKNGTLLIDYTNNLMKRGMHLREALIEAGTTRLRPIMMT
ncbi:efflux RND transporter permease subunit [Clostridium sp. DJ247]|nr:efflux RND transporter permease subunit [Clostridium sp. DJ247]MBC2578849.1 efflux RND transporter permease subunit [Clostridium sp. DJ247]